VIPANNALPSLFLPQPQVQKGNFAIKTIVTALGWVN
jgi:hypothetical protein